jgi:hypothetical protein
MCKQMHVPNGTLEGAAQAASATFLTASRSGEHLVRIPVGTETQECSDIPDAV